MKYLFSIIVLYIIIVANAFAAQFTVNGTNYNGQKLKVYPNSESIFEIRLTEGSISRAESSNQNFTTRSEVLAQQMENGLTVSNNNSAKVFVRASSGTRLNSTSKISLLPLLNSSGQSNFPFFEVILSPIPSISNIELMSADIKNLQKGLPIRIIVKGTGLDDLDLNLPKGINSKIIKSSDNEMTLELSSRTKSFKGIVIDQNSFKIKAINQKVNFKAKNMDLSRTK